MSCLLLISQAYASTPNIGGAGLDLILIVACLSLLVGMVYLCKFLLEKYRIARNSTLWQQTSSDTLDEGNEKK